MTPEIVSIKQAAAGPPFFGAAHRLLAGLVADGAALGWIDGRLKDFVAVGERRYDKVFYQLDLRRRYTGRDWRPYEEDPCRNGWSSG